MELSVEDSVGASAASSIEESREDSADWESEEGKIWRMAA